MAEKKIINVSGQLREMTFEEILEQYQYLIRKWTVKYNKNGEYDYEDMEQEAMLCCFKCYKHYDDTKYSFSTLLCTFLHNHFIRYIDKERCKGLGGLQNKKNKANIVSFDEPAYMSCKNGDVVYYADIVGKEDDNLSIYEENYLVELIMSRLSIKEKKLFTDRILNNKTLEQIGTDQKVTKERIRQKTKDLMIKVKRIAMRYFEEEDYKEYLRYKEDVENGQ